LPALFTVKAAAKPTRLTPKIRQAGPMGIIKLTAFGADQTSIGLQVGYKPKEYYKRVTIYLTL
jgi:hypothetical protein